MPARGDRERGREQRRRTDQRHVLVPCRLRAGGPRPQFDLFADAAPGVVEDGVLVARDRRVQLLQDNLDTAAAVDKASDVVHHGSVTEHAGALVGWPAPHRPDRNRLIEKGISLQCISKSC